MGLEEEVGGWHSQLLRDPHSKWIWGPQICTTECARCVYVCMAAEHSTLNVVLCLKKVFGDKLIKL